MPSEFLFAAQKKYARVWHPVFGTSSIVPIHAGGPGAYHLQGVVPAWNLSIVTDVTVGDLAPWFDIGGGWGQTKVTEPGYTFYGTQPLIDAPDAPLVVATHGQSADAMGNVEDSFDGVAQALLEAGMLLVVVGTTSQGEPNAPPGYNRAADLVSQADGIADFLEAQGVDVDEVASGLRPLLFLGWSEGGQAVGHLAYAAAPSSDSPLRQQLVGTWLEGPVGTLAIGPNGPPPLFSVQGTNQQDLGAGRYFQIDAAMDGNIAPGGNYFEFERKASDWLKQRAVIRRGRHAGFTSLDPGDVPDDAFIDEGAAMSLWLPQAAQLRIVADLAVEFFRYCVSGSLVLPDKLLSPLLDYTDAINALNLPGVTLVPDQGVVSLEDQQDTTTTALMVADKEFGPDYWGSPSGNTTVARLNDSLGAGYLELGGDRASSSGPLTDWEFYPAGSSIPNIQGASHRELLLWAWDAPGMVLLARREPLEQVPADGSLLFSVGFLPGVTTSHSLAGPDSAVLPFTLFVVLKGPPAPVDTFMSARTLTLCGPVSAHRERMDVLGSVGAERRHMTPMLSTFRVAWSDFGLEPDEVNLVEAVGFYPDPSTAVGLLMLTPPRIT